MDYINQVISRIENNNRISINFDIDQWVKKGTRCEVDGLIRRGNQWKVQLLTLDKLGSIEEITFVQYMTNTKDIG